ncbi:MAG: hypothetical protein H7Y43_09945 [Akkermansiaceae bacterium]|nr:hypothetical protein [Verrucomicrobiales bacterium]
MQRSRTFRILTGAALVAALAVWYFSARPRSATNPSPTETANSPSSEHSTSPGNRLDAGAVADLRPIASPDLPKSQLLRDVITAIEGIHSASDVHKKEERFQKAAASVAAADLPAVIGFLWNKEHLSGTGAELRDRLLQRWAELDPKAASEWVSKQPAGSMQTDAINRIARAWADVDFDEAVAWANQLGDENLKHESLAQIAYREARTNPLAALQLAVEIPAGTALDNLLAHIGPLWAVTDATAALDWAKEIANEVLRESVIASMLSGMGEKSPAKAAELALDLLSAGQKQDDTLVTIIGHWTQDEPEVVAAWVMQFPKGKLQETAIESFVPIWADRDFEHVSKWVNGLPQGLFRDHVIGAFLPKILLTSPQSAAQLVAGMSDPVLRQREMDFLAQSQPAK